MNAIKFYYLILVIYICLWSSQQIVCHLTHSLIILTDSYINLYKILDISIGILHIRTQQKISQFAPLKGNGDDKYHPVELFGHLCTYQFKRLPLLGSFINGLFLAALLMSAAIEGIQTCIHASHSIPDGSERSILLQHPVTYPAILTGFAVVGVVMQWCSSLAHEKREKELALEGSESSSSTDSLFHSTVPKKRVQTKETKKADGDIKQLDAAELAQADGNKIVMKEMSKEMREQQVEKYSNFVSISLDDNIRDPPDERKLSFKTKSASSIPSDLSDHSNVSLRSFKINISLDQQIASIKIPSISASFTLDQKVTIQEYTRSETIWALIRCFTSPLALVCCASIVYFINIELVTEIADAGLAILVVSLLFSASYPPMKKSSRVLLQTSPLDVDPKVLTNQLKALSPCILDVMDLHVWSLTSSNRDNRIASLHLILDRRSIGEDAQAMKIMGMAKTLLKQNSIGCTTIQLALIDPTAADDS